MPATAIFRHELRGLSGNWLVRLWLPAAALLAILTVTGGWSALPDRVMIGSLMFPFLVFPWFIVALVLGVSPVTGARAEALADGILSRPITRHEYLWAAWAARVVVVLGVYLIVVVPAVAIVVFAQRPAPSDQVTLYGTSAGLALVGLVQAFLVSLGFLAGTLLKRPLLATVVLLFVWYPVNLVLNVFALEEFSPISLNQAMPTLLAQSWRAEELSGEAAASEKDMEAMAREAARFLSVLSGQPQAPAEPPRRPRFFERDEFQDFALWRVVLGYGIPTALGVALATIVFCRRDF